MPWPALEPSETTVARASAGRFVNTRKPATSSVRTAGRSWRVSVRAGRVQAAGRATAIRPAATRTAGPGPNATATAPASAGPARAATP